MSLQLQNFELQSLCYYRLQYTDYTAGVSSNGLQFGEKLMKACYKDELGVWASLMPICFLFMKNSRETNVLLTKNSHGFFLEFQENYILCFECKFLKVSRWLIDKTLCFKTLQVEETLNFPYNSSGEI